MQITARRVLQLYDPSDAGDEASALVLPMAEADAVMGETVAAYVARVAWRFDLPTVCRINGEFYSRAEWQTRALGLNDNVEFISRPLGSGGGNSTGKTIGALVAMIALTAVAGPLGGGIAGAAFEAGSVGFAIASSLASAAIVGAGAAPIAFWTAPRAPWWRRRLAAVRDSLRPILDLVSRLWSPA
jgi:sulfur carrier protein ThiS